MKNGLCFLARAVAELYLCIFSPKPLGLEGGQPYLVPSFISKIQRLVYGSGTLAKSTFCTWVPVTQPGHRSGHVSVSIQSSVVVVVAGISTTERRILLVWLFDEPRTDSDLCAPGESVVFRLAATRSYWHPGSETTLQADVAAPTVITRKPSLCHSGQRILKASTGF